MSENKVTQLRLALRRNGYQPIPVAGLLLGTSGGAGKAPQMRDWQKICAEADERTIRSWESEQRLCTNTGLLTGAPGEDGNILVGLDVDVLDEKLVDRIIDVVEIFYGIPAIRRIGRAPKLLLPYRAASSFRKICTSDLIMPDGQKAAVELLALGQQFVAFGDHPGTQRPYQWIGGSPETVPLSELPELEEAKFRLIIQDCEDVLRAAGGRTAAEIKKAELAGRRFAGVKRSDEIWLESLREALSCIPNDDLPYDQWQPMGFAIYAAAGEAGRELWEEWSAKSDKNDPNVTAAKWPSFAGVKYLNAGYIFDLARRNGWRKRKEPIDQGGVVICRASDLGLKKFRDLRYVVPAYIPEGLTLFSGKPKIGKSWFCLDVALAVATGGVCLGGVECEQGEVLYLGLEDNERRLHSRISKLLPFDDVKDWPASFHYTTDFPRGEAAISALRSWLENTPKARLIVVDVLTMLREERSRQQTQYEADYGAVKGLQKLSSDFGIAVLIVHHNRKSTGESDPFEKVSGTLGLSGAADAVLILDKQGDAFTLYGRGREIEEIETAIEFNRDDCRWELRGDAAEVRRSVERRAILEVLLTTREPMSARDIAYGVGGKEGNIRYLLGRMLAKDEVKRTARGRYAHPDILPGSGERPNEAD